MALADELLDNISEEQFAEYMLVEENPHIVIDKDRNIILPERYKVIAAQGDHNMATYTFDCPRFSDGRDMSKMVVYINYIRSDGETGSYPADNVSIDAQDNNLMHFEWTPLLPATLEHGAFAFLVCVCRTEPDGNMKNHWSTRLCKDATISEGMDCHQNTIIDMCPDVITRILERLNVLEDGGTTSVQYTVQDLEEEQKVQARKNIEAADAKEVSKLSEDIATKASAIKEKASGELIIVNDSAEAKVSGLAIDGKSEQNQYSGKNKCGIVETFSGYYSDSTGEKNTGNSNFIGLEKIPVLPSTQYAVSSNLTIYTVWFLNASGKPISRNAINNTSGTFTTSGDCAYIGTSLRNTSGVADTTAYEWFQLELGSTATDYEPFVGGKPSPNTEYKQEIRNIGVYDEASGKYAVEVKCTGKNLLKKVDLKTKTENGITFTINEDGSITVNGTSPDTVFFNLDWVSENANYVNDVTSILGKELIASLGHGDDNIKMGVGYFDEALSAHNMHNVGIAEQKFTYPSSAIYARTYLTVTGGVTLNNVTVYPMIRLVGTDGTYEPYKETTATVLLDEPLRKGDKAYWNGGSKVRVDRYKNRVVLNGKEDWRKGNTNDGSKIRPTLVSSNSLEKVPKANADSNVTSDIYCDNYIAKTPNETYYLKQGISIDGDGNVNIYDDVYANLTIDDWKTHLAKNPITVEYELATPITEEIDIDLGELSMFYPTTILSNDCNANMEVTYIADTKAYIDKKFAELATAMV